jgi:hypothetical protein
MQTDHRNENGDTPSLRTTGSAQLHPFVFSVYCAFGLNLDSQVPHVVRAHPEQINE